jgi:LPXTG-motif cell wall-anchored protein
MIRRRIHAALTAALAAVVALTLVGAPALAWNAPPPEQEPALPAEGVLGLDWADGKWTLTVEPGAWEIKVIEPVNKVLCGKNYGKPCATTYELPTSAHCVMVQVDWYGKHNSTDPWRCKPSKPTPTPTTTATPEPTPEPTGTPEPTPTATPEPTPSATPDPSPTPEPTATPTPEATATSSPSPTVTPEPTPTATPEPSPTPEPTVTPTSTPVPTPTPSSTPEPTPTPTPSVTPTATPEPSTSPTQPAQPSPSATEGVGPTPQHTTAPGTAAPTAGVDSRHALASTGSTSPTLIALAALGLVLVGLTFLAARKRAQR